MEGVMGLAQTEIEKLRQENHQLKEQNKSLDHQLKQVRGKIFKPRVKPRHDGDQPKRGAPGGHRGNSRRRPEVISEFIDFYPEKCDHCGGKVNSYENHFDEHVTEDIEIRKRVTCRRFHYGYCQRCKKVVYARKDEIPARDRIGYEGIKQSIRHSPSVNADETGWRVNGDNHWLWVFTNKEASLYHIDESRGARLSPISSVKSIRGFWVATSFQFITSSMRGQSNAAWHTF
ncbi:transposase, partial [Dehalococcoidia bacterium]|nr:transposase [Dehalococcoidia bacterium]MCL0103577.1 transposase [Dehalococcoidia bacterium]